MPFRPLQSGAKLPPFRMASQLKASFLVLALASSGIGASCHNQSSSTDVAKQDPAASSSATATTVDLPGIDTSSLTPREKSEWSSYVSELLSPCSDTPVPIAQCVKEKRSCSRCVSAAKFLLKGVRDGLSKEQIEKSYKGRFDASKIKSVPIDGSPTTGPESAPLVVVEFADFECPFCAMMAPILEKVRDERKSQLLFVYKFMPLSGHPHGEIAARAGIAAWRQGKFWEMNHTMFANREHLEQSDLESYAKDLGLDVAKFKADAASQYATDRIAQDRKLADSLEVKGTPTIYINGREYDPKSDLNDWLNLELSMSDGKAAPVTTTSADAGAVLLDAGKRK